MNQKIKTNHIPVLLMEVIEQFGYLNKFKDGYFVDGTLGAGGHSIAIAQSLLHLEGERGANTFEVIPRLKVIGIDRDEQALKITRDNIKKAGLDDAFILFHTNYENINDIVAELGIGKISGALLDLGVSSMQLDQSERGFTFQDNAARLDMRMDQAQDFSANDIVNNFSEDKIRTILKEVGEERFARSIAKNIAKFRKTKRIETVGELLSIIKSSMPAKYIHTHGKHFATNTFRALRITVNDELNNLDKTIIKYVDLLERGARLATITFHSSEDRIVKNTLRNLENPCICPPKAPICTCGRLPKVMIITKKPIIPTDQEINVNPRSRSAKLRVIEKL